MVGNKTENAAISFSSRLGFIGILIILLVIYCGNVLSTSLPISRNILRGRFRRSFQSGD